MTLPSQVLDLSNWKITLPTGDKNKPKELSGKDLAAYSNTSTFWVGSDGAVHFRAAVNGVTTSGSANPRSELREMSGSSLASWSSTDGKTHTMVIDQAVVYLPGARTDGGTAGVVAGQIHNADNDICVFRLEGSKLYVTNGDTTHYALADAGYVLGTRFKAMFVVHDGQVDAYYNGRLITTIATKFTGAYFKAGCYTQANSSNSKPADSTNYGEVAIFAVTVAHGASVPADPPPTEPFPPVEVPPVVTPIPKAKRTIIMLRHFEKDDNGDGKDDVLHELSAKGNQREKAFTAAWLAGPPNGLPKPDRCIASKGTSASNRPLESIQPYQLAAGLPMNTTYDAEVDYKKLGPWLAQRLDVTMVCMEHSAIIDTFKLLGKISPALPKAWDEKRFDLYWVFTSDDGKNWKFTQIPQLLLPGDSAKPIK